MTQNKKITFNKNQFTKFSWSFGNAIMIVLTFILGSWFGIFLGFYSFLMGVKFCQNNWIPGLNKVIVTKNIVSKEYAKR